MEVSVGFGVVLVVSSLIVKTTARVIMMTSSIIARITTIAILAFVESEAILNP